MSTSQSIRGAGIDDADLNAHGEVAAHAYRKDRQVNSKGAPPRDGAPANTNADLLAEKAQFEQAVLKPAGELKKAAMAKLDVLAPPAPAKGHAAAAKVPPAATRAKDGKRDAGVTPALPPGFTDARQFLDRLKEVTDDVRGDFTVALRKRGILLDLAEARRWATLLSERRARSLGDAVTRDDLHAIHKALVLLQPRAPEQ